MTAEELGGFLSPRRETHVLVVVPQLGIHKFAVAMVPPFKKLKKRGEHISQRHRNFRNFIPAPKKASPTFGILACYAYTKQNKSMSKSCIYRKIHVMLES